MPPRARLFARQYFGHNAFCFDPTGGVFAKLARALDGSFTVTAWVLTTNSVGNDDDAALFGNPILFVDTDGQNILVPLSITGSKLAFLISDARMATTIPGCIQLATINDGTYHFIGATRNVTNGVIKLYVDGNLNGTIVGPTNVLALDSDIFVAGGYRYGFLPGHHWIDVRTSMAVNCPPRTWLNWPAIPPLRSAAR